MRCETDGPGRSELQALERDYGRISHVPGTALAPGRNHEQLQRDAGPAHKTPPVEARRARAQNRQMVARAGASISRNEANTR